MKATPSHTTARTGHHPDRVADARGGTRHHQSHGDASRRHSSAQSDILVLLHRFYGKLWVGGYAGDGCSYLALPDSRTEGVSAALWPHFYRCESLPVLERYATGLLADIARKSGAGIAEAVAGLSESAVYRLLAQSAWDEAAVNRQRIAVMVEQATAGDGMLVFDETSFPRQGPKSVGVAHQYCGALGKTANCQVVVTADYLDPYYAWPALGQLYLPEAWCQDPECRATAGYRRSSAFTPSRNWPCCCSIRPGRRGFRLPGWAPMPVTATTPTFSMGWTSARWAVWWASPVTLACVCWRKSRRRPPGRCPSKTGGPPTHASASCAGGPPASRRCGAGESAGDRLAHHHLAQGQYGTADQAVQRPARYGADMPIRPAPRAGSSASARCRGRRASPSSIGVICRPRRHWRVWPSWRIGVPVSNAATKTAKVRPAWAMLCGPRVAQLPSATDH